MTSAVHNPKIFISYSHDSPQHMDRVLELANRLRSDGVDCSIDLYETSPPMGWARWTESQIEKADFVLVICTATYLRRFKGEEASGIGRGAKWEGAVITKELYEAEANNSKFIPILIAETDSAYVPKTLSDVTRYQANTEDDYESLYRRVTEQPRVLEPELGRLRAMPPRKRKQHFPPASESLTITGAQPIDLNSYFSSQQRIIEDHSKRFVRRINVQRAFERFIESHTSGYFMVRGEPGQGKTAVSSNFVKNYDCIHHFISRTGRRSDVRLILRSLLAQLVRRTGSETVIPESIPDLASAMEDLLSDAVKKESPLILVVDALDELAEEGRAHLSTLFTDSLPDDTYVVVTSRPGDAFSRLEEQLFTSPYEIFDLGPLELSEVREILSSHHKFSNAETERIADASQGNPLYLLAVIEELERNSTFDLKRAP